MQVVRMVRTMKYKTAVVAVSLALASVLLIGAARGWSRRADRQERQVVASFYPVYIAAINVTEGAEDVNVIYLSQSQTGCLHEFSLRPQDLITLDGVAHSLPSLPVVESSSGISLLHTEPTLHVGGEHAEESGENAHVWMSPRRYEQQVRNICSELSAQFPQDAALFEENAERYISRVEALRREMAEKLVGANGMQVILFHDSFAYFADEFGMKVGATIPIEEDTALTAGEIAQVIEKIKSTGIRVLFAEKQYSTELADAIARETDARVYLLDTGVGGENSPDAYLDAMRKNMETVQRALQETAAAKE